MKKITTFLFAIIIATGVFAQSPDKMSYQTVIRNAGGSLVNGPVGIKISILQGSISGSAVFVETHTLNTNVNGLATLTIGNGANISGTIAGIDWSAGPYFIKTETDPTGGTSYTIVGTSELQSVPYALHSKGGWTKTGNDISSPNSGNVGIGVASPSKKLDVAGNIKAIAIQLTSGASIDNVLQCDALGNASWVPASTLAISEADPKVGSLAVNSVPKWDGTTLLNGSIVDDGTNVGIGTAAPATVLDITMPSLSPGSSPTVRTDAGGWYIKDYSNGLRAGLIDDPAGGFTGIYGDGMVTPSISMNGGYVGIGTTTPGNNLDVVGGANVTGGYVTFCTQQDNTQGNVGMGFGGYNNVKLALQSSQDFGLFIEGTTLIAAAYINGALTCTGTLSKGGGSFKIDHPLDPANKYLYHSFVESPDMMNVYNGNITTDASGLATVTLPDYFEALNKDFRYQLTAVGQFAQVIVKEKVQGNKFVIQTDKPNVEISWQVTGIRHDAWANQNRIPNAVDKAGAERGLYLHPEVFGKSADYNVSKALVHPKEKASK